MAMFVRVGALDDPDRYPPDVHLYVESRQPWVLLPDTVEQFPGFYAGKDVVRLYGEANAARWKALWDRKKAG